MTKIITDKMSSTFASFTLQDSHAEHSNSSSFRKKKPDLEICHDNYDLDEPEQWVNPKINIFRLFGAFWFMFMMGSNDAAYGVRSIFPRTIRCCSNKKLT